MPFLVFLLSLVIAAPAWAADAILKVRANVADAEVFLDGRSLGPAPITTYLPPGVHQLRVVADRHDPFVRRIEVGEGKTLEVSATLVPGRGTAEWIGPAGARLFLDGEPRGVLPIRLPDLAAGSYEWRVEAPKFEPTTGRFDFQEGKNYLFEVVLQPSLGVFVVQSTPPGAEVRIDGRAVGTTPLRLEGVDPGVHGVAVIHPEHPMVVRTVDTTDGGRGEVIVSLPTSGAALKVSAPDDARVFVNGVLVGEGASVKTDRIEKGRATVRVETGGRTIEQALSVPAAGTVSLMVDDGRLVARKPLVERWGFWAAIGGGVAAGAGTAVAVAVATQPEPLPTGDVVVVLP